MVAAIRLVSHPPRFRDDAVVMLHELRFSPFPPILSRYKGTVSPKLTAARFFVRWQRAERGTAKPVRAVRIGCISWRAPRLRVDGGRVFSGPDWRAYTGPPRWCHPSQPRHRTAPRVVRRGRGGRAVRPANREQFAVKRRRVRLAGAGDSAGPLDRLHRELSRALRGRP
jgi:hypothetical protein